MNEDIPIYSIVLLKIVAVVQVTFGLTLILVGSFFLFIMVFFVFASLFFVSAACFSNSFVIVGNKAFNKLNLESNCLTSSVCSLTRFSNAVFSVNHHQQQ